MNRTIDLQVCRSIPISAQLECTGLTRILSRVDEKTWTTVFEDTRHCNLAAEETYGELINESDQVGRMIESFRQFIGTSQMMAYLVMMAVRLKELHRVQKPTGSLYLHCDLGASLR